MRQEALLIVVLMGFLPGPAWSGWTGQIESDPRPEPPGLRGQLTVWRLSNPDGTIDLKIINQLRRSVEDRPVGLTLKGGTFSLYWDDADGVRNEVEPFLVFAPGTAQPWGVTGQLPYGEFTQATFLPMPGAVRYVLGYQGPVGDDPNDRSVVATTEILCSRRIWVWGKDRNGVISNKPKEIEYIRVAAGKFHGLALKEDGSLAAWGANSAGQCDVPVGYDFVEIAAGAKHSVALRADGSLAVWGDDSWGQVTAGPQDCGFTAIAACDYHSVALKSDGTAVEWGRCSTEDGGTLVDRVRSLSCDVGYVAVAAGNFHCAALRADDRVDLWGSNTAYQTQLYQAAKDEVFTRVAASGLYSLLLQADGRLVSWGNGEAILVPNPIDPSLPPKPVGPRYHYLDSEATPGGISAVSGGADHLLVLTSDRQVVKFNWPSGDPTQVEDWVKVKDIPSEVNGVDEVSAGNGFSMVLGIAP